MNSPPSGHPAVAALLGVLTASVFLSTALVNVAAAALSILALYQWFRWRPFVLLRHPLSLCCIAFLAWAMVRELIDGRSIGHSAKVIDAFRTFGFILLWAPLMRPAMHRRAVIHVIAAGLVLFSLTAVVTLATTGKPFYLLRIDPHELGLPHWLEIAYAYLLKRGPDLGGPILVAGVFGAVQLAWDGDPRRRGWLLALAALGAIALLFATGRRTSHFGFALCALLIVLWNIRRLTAVAAVSLVATLVLVIGLLAASPVANDGLRKIVAEAQAFQATPKEQRAQLISSTGERLQFWAVSARVAMESPLIGIGVTAFPDHYSAQAATLGGDTPGQRRTNPHNELLYMFCTLGAIGLALYLAVHLAVLRNASLLRNGTQRKVLYLYMAALLSSLPFNSMMVDMIPGHFYALAVLALGWFEWDRPELAGARA